jgi:predicted CXXCH cytochrome family protein
VGARFSRKGPDHGDAAVADLSISCEACHGPGAAHVRRHQNPLERYAARNDAIGEADIVLPTSLDATRNASVCGRCHSETWPYDEPRARFSPGDELDAHTRVVQYQPPPYPPWLAAAVDEDDELLASGFWRDGTIRIAGRDYNALRISPCHLEGALTCTTCHQMHGADPNDQLRPEARDNRVCVGCHSGIGADVSAHTHHAPESPGSLCYDCHMPRTTLGLLTVMRAHRIDSPSASVSAESGRPNACNLCHLDRTLSEVAGDLARWYGRPPARIAQSDTAAAVEWLVAGDGVQRAVSAWHFGYGPAQLASGDGWQAPLLAHALTDPYPAVRYIAGKSLASLPGFVGFEDDYVALPDERRSIRERALGQWIVPNDARATTLISAHGLEHGRFSALRAQRDDTPVTVNE